ncbi:hypothetical protein RI367_004612 [Sorochytrium milnesiophthora]
MRLPLLLAVVLLVLLPLVKAQSQTTKRPLVTFHAAADNAVAATATTTANSTAPTSTPTALPNGNLTCPVCPTCFTCASEGCLNFGQCTNAVCQCHAGLGGKDCGLATCNSTNVPASQRSPRPDREQCVCDDGFTGINCNVCTRDDVCQSIANVPASEQKSLDTRICNRSPRVYKRSQMMCESNSDLISGLYGSNIDATIERDLVNGVGFATLWLQQVPQFSCSMTGCKASLVDQVDKWKCDDIKCQCLARTKMCGGGGVAMVDLTTPLAGVSGNFELSCPLQGNGNATISAVLDPKTGQTTQQVVNGGNCNFLLTGLQALLPDGINLQKCIFGECAYSSDAPSDLSQKTSFALGAGGIGGLSGLGCVLAAALFAFCMGKRQQRILRAMPIPTPQRGAVLQFSDITYEIKATKQKKTRNGKVDMAQSSRESADILNNSGSLAALSPNVAAATGSSRVILKSVSGVARPGRMLAIMGPSGAGKSSLLDILAHKTKRGTIQGTFMVDGRRVAFPSKSLRTMIGYVDQEDVLLPYLTVRECLMFSVNVRLAESTPAATKAAIVESVMKQLGILEIADSRIGGSGSGHRGISGGERRRVSIGIELVTSPAILFLDEPTSGLDSHNAHKLMQTLSLLARDQGKTIICSIHQPRSDVYAMCDDVCVLSKGQVVYFGDRRHAGDEFARRGFVCPTNYNMADYLIDLAIMHQNGEVSSVTGQPVVDPSARSSLSSHHNRHIFPDGGGRISPIELGDDDTIGAGSAGHTRTNTPAEGRLHHRRHSASAADSLDMAVDMGAAPPAPGMQSPPLSLEDDRDGDAEYVRGYNVSFLTQVGVLSGRAHKCLWRNPKLLLGHNVIAILLGVIVGLLYFQSPNTLAGLQNRFGSVFFIEALIGFSSLSALGTFVGERLLFVRERGNRCYHPTAFFFVKCLFDIFPLRILPAITLGTIAYFMIGFQPVLVNYLRYIVILVLFSVVTALFCLAMAVYIRDVSLGNLMSSIVMLFAMLLGGILINASKIPVYLRWIQYLSFFRYSTEALTVNEVSGLTVADDIAGVKLNIPGSVVLQSLFGFDLDSFTRNLLVLAGLVLALLVTVGLLVRYKLKEVR